MSAKWRNRGFQALCPLRYSNVDNHSQMRVPLWEPKNAPRGFQDLSQAKILRIDALKRVRRTVSFYQMSPSSKVAQLSAQRPLWPANSPMGVSGVKVWSFSL